MTAIPGPGPRSGMLAGPFPAISRPSVAAAGPPFGVLLQLGSPDRFAASRCTSSVPPAVAAAEAPRSPSLAPSSGAPASLRLGEGSRSGRGVEAEGEGDGPRREAVSDLMLHALLESGSRAPMLTSPLPATFHVPPPSVAPASLEHLMSRLVRRIAWAGDAHRGSARLTLGAGSLEGATLTIHADAGVLRVELELPPGVDGRAWRDRIAERLSARGLQLAALDVE